MLRWTLSLVTAFLMLVNLTSCKMLNSQNRPSQSVYKEAAAFGDRLVFVGNEKMQWLSCYQFTFDGGKVYVDTETGKAAIIQYNQIPLSERRLHMEDARIEAENWLSEHGIDIKAYTLSYSKYINRHSGGAEFIFKWNRFTSDGVSLPCIISVTIREDGFVRSVYRIERELQVDTVPRIDLKDTISKAASTVGINAESFGKRELYVWFDPNGAQKLYLTLYRKDTDKPYITLDAHTGDIIAVYKNMPRVQSKTEDSLDYSKIQALKVENVLNDFPDITRVRIYASKTLNKLSPDERFSDVQLVGDIKGDKNKAAFNRLMTAIKDVLKTPRSLIIEKRVRLRSSPGLWLMLDMPSKKMAYFSVLSLDHRSFLVYAKMRWPRIEENGGRLWPSHAMGEKPIDYKIVSLVVPLSPALQKIVLDNITPECRKAILAGVDHTDRRLGLNLKK